jgi:arylsulfatase A-like enzyme
LPSDLLPTLLDLAGVDRPESYALGKSIAPVIRDRSKSVHSFTTFSYDDLMIRDPGADGNVKGVGEEAQGPVTSLE